MLASGVAGQRGMVAARAKPLFEEEARGRQSAVGGASPGALSANLREAVGKSAEKAASMLNVSPRTVESAAKVLDRGTEELAKLVEGGRGVFEGP